MNYNVKQIQMVYFFKEWQEMRPFVLSSILYNEMKDYFSSDPMTMNEDDNMPVDMPRCVWVDGKNQLIFNKISLNISLNKVEEMNWADKLKELNKKISNALSKVDIKICRIGIILNACFYKDFRDYELTGCNIAEFKEAKECKISWLKKRDKYNIWKNYEIGYDDLQDKSMYNLILDVNTDKSWILCEDEVSTDNIINKAIDIFEENIKNE